MEKKETKEIRVDLSEAFLEEAELEAFKEAMRKEKINVRLALFHLFNGDKKVPQNGIVQCLTMEEIEWSMEDEEDNSFMRILAYEDPRIAVFNEYYMEHLGKTCYRIKDPLALRLLAKLDI